MWRWSAAALLVAALGLGGGLVAYAQESPDADAFQGVWKLVSMTMDGEPVQASGYTIFEGEHFSYITTFERERFADRDADSLSDDERRLLAFGTMTAAAGVYRVEGDAIVFIQEVTRTPHLSGGVARRRFELDGDRWIQDFEGGGRRRVIVWERVSPGR